MVCHICRNNASLQCPRCKRFCCSYHSTQEHGFSKTEYICENCAQEVRTIAVENAQKLADAKASAERQSIEKKALADRLAIQYKANKEREDREREERREKERIENEREEERRLNAYVECTQCKGTGKDENSFLGLKNCHVCKGRGQLTGRKYDEYVRKLERNYWKGGDGSGMNDIY